MNLLHYYLGLCGPKSSGELKDWFLFFPLPLGRHRNACDKQVVCVGVCRAWIETRVSHAKCMCVGKSGSSLCDRHFDQDALSLWQSDALTNPRPTLRVQMMLFVWEGRAIPSCNYEGHAIMKAMGPSCRTVSNIHAIMKALSATVSSGSDKNSDGFFSEYRPSGTSVGYSARVPADVTDLPVTLAFITLWITARMIAFWLLNLRKFLEFREEAYLRIIISSGTVSASTESVAAYRHSEKITPTDHRLAERGRGAHLLLHICKINVKRCR